MLQCVKVLFQRQIKIIIASIEKKKLHSLTNNVQCETLRGKTKLFIHVYYCVNKILGLYLHLQNLNFFFIFAIKKITNEL